MSSWTPSIVPTDDQSIYLVLDDFGRHGRAWRETDIKDTDLETVITDMLEGQYQRLKQKEHHDPLPRRPRSGRKSPFRFRLFVSAG